MTRDEAIKLAGDTGAIRPGDFIDMCVNLGMLKLDEPKSAADRVWEVFTNGFASNKDDLIKELDAAGLKIVEK